MRALLLAGALLGVAEVAGCGGLSKDPADGLSFRPPPGWSSDIRLLGVDVFASPGHREFMSLTTMPPGPDLEERLLDGATYRNPREVQQSDITICSGKDAELTTALVYFISGRKDMNLEMVTTEQPDNILVADYIYPIGSKPDKRATAAIRRLCPA